jgi:hypothetical protein
MRLSRLALYLALFAFVGREPAHATEIAPTPKMLADAREMNAARWPDDKGRKAAPKAYKTGAIGYPVRR